MIPSTPTICPLRQRLLDDMRMRKLVPKTQSAYVRAVRYLASFLQRSPDTASAEDLRRFQLHLVDRGVSPITLNATITGLKFFFDVTLNRGELVERMNYVHVPQKLPMVLNRAVHDAAEAAKIDKRVTMHTLRHSFATHLLEQKVDIRVIQVMPGHKKLETTSVYTHVATEVLREVVSPLEKLQPA
ncbi:hypothetical protein GmRootV213_52220 (plasmid) [Variovorax sp. V213]|uniref:tyrosine-type recombinase/integrase n=1 Tax=Variovorax sp. V213 TaxID=3065955 RepID=UPI0034E87410